MRLNTVQTLITVIGIAISAGATITGAYIQRNAPNSSSRQGLLTIEKVFYSAAIILFIGTVWLVARAGYVPKVDAQTKAERFFSGIVREKQTGRSISGAVVLAAQDQSVPETLTTDSNGLFTLRLLPSTQSLHLSVSATGYEPLDVQANPQRTGPEQIILFAKTKPPRSPRTKAVNASTSVSTPKDSEPSHSKPNQPGSDNLSIGINNGLAIGTNFGTATVNVGPIAPARRVLHEDARKAAHNILWAAPTGSSVRLDLTGMAKDGDDFVSQIAALFAGAGWHVLQGVRTLNETNLSSFSSGASVDHGEGVRCAGGDQRLMGLVEQALQQAGFPCNGAYAPSMTERPRLRADVYLSIGPPVIEDSK